MPPQANNESPAPEGLGNGEQEVNAGLEVLDGAQPQGEGGEETPATPAESGGEEGSTPSPAESTPTPGLSREDITAILKEVGVGQAPQAAPAAAQPEQLTEAEIARRFNLWQPDENFVNKLLRSENPKDVVTALVEMRDNLAKQMSTIYDARLQQVLQNYHDQNIRDVQTFVAEQQAVKFREDFFKAHPDLSEHEQLVDAVAAKLAQNGFRGKNRKEVIDTYAKETKALLKTLLPQKPNEGQGAQRPQPQGSRKSMSTLIGGGHVTGRAGGAGKQEGPLAEALAVFDE